MKSSIKKALPCAWNLNNRGFSQGNDINITLPIKTVSEANTKAHWTVGYQRNKQQKDIVKKSLLAYSDIVLKFPLTITVTRIAPRMLDAHDNLRTSLKWVVDAIADFIFPGLKAGRADDSPDLIWHYSQKKGKPREYGVEISIISHNPNPSEKDFD